MKNGVKNAALLCTGIILGAAMFGGAAHAASSVLAERSANRVYVDGKEVRLESYLIGGSNYIQLRDVGRAVGFNVYWDGAVQIESGKPYTGEAPASAAPMPTSIVSAPASNAAQATSPVEDYAAKANPAVLKGEYTREAYNALRQTILTGADSVAVSMSDTTRAAMESASAAFGEWPAYHLKSAPGGAAYFTAKCSENNQPAADYCQTFLDGLAGKSDRDKVREIAFYVCDRLTYDAGSTATPRTALSSGGVSKGNCMSYAHSFQFLCDMAGIPCMFVHSSTHQWNQVYVDGRWWNVDVSGVDVGDDTASRGYSQVLYDDAYLQGATFRQTEPELTAFVKEVLAPGSTK